MNGVASDGHAKKVHAERKDGGILQNRRIRLIAGAVNSFQSKGDKLPVVCIFGHDGLNLATPVQEDYEEERLDCRCYPSDFRLNTILVRDRPHVIITIGNRASFPHLITSPFQIQKRWLHYDTLPGLARLGLDAYKHYLSNMLNEQVPDDTPLVTVFTPTYRTGGAISRPFQSLKEQTYSNWEWIIVDDSDDGGRTF